MIYYDNKDSCIVLPGWSVPTISQSYSDNIQSWHVASLYLSVSVEPAG